MSEMHGRHKNQLKRSDYAVTILIASLAIALRVVASPRTIDDAYITFRYARNLAAGLGFVYNPGQHVLGTTTPLYTVLMATFWSFGLHDLASVALVVNALADAGTSVLLHWLGLRLSGSRIVAIGAGLTWAFSPMSVTFAIGGMETSVVILFLVASFAAYTVDRSRLSAALMALAVLTRPDALIAAGLLLADMVLRPLLARNGGTLPGRLRRLPWAEIAIFALLLAPWIAFATAYFGSPLPQSVQAKVRAYHLDAFSALVRFIQHLATPFFEHELFGRFWPAIGFPLYLLMYLAGCLRMIRHDPRTVPLALYPLVYVVVFSAANPLVFRWYLAPPLPFYFSGILLGVNGLLTDLGRHFKREQAAHWASGLLIVLLLALSLNAYTLHPDHGPDRPAPKMAWFKLELLYRKAAALVKPGLEPGDTIAAGDIGAVGWYTGARVLDTVGLVTPEAAQYYPLDQSLLVISYAMAPDLIRSQQPDFIITLEVYVRESLVPQPWFQREYVQAQRLESDIYGSEGMLIFKRMP
jgi:hypothetical protein